MNSNFAGRMWGIISTIFALNFIAFWAFIGIMASMGKVNSDTATGLLMLLRGSHVAVKNEEIQELASLRRKVEENRKAEEERTGSGRVAGDAAAAREADIAVRKEEALQIEARLGAAKQALGEERQKLEGVKKELQAALEELDQAKANLTVVAQDEATQRLRKILSGMDAAEIAGYLTTLATSQPGKDDAAGPEKAAALLKMLQPAQAGEILAEMPPAARALIFPLMENKYAGLEGNAVAAAWKSEKLTVKQMATFMRSMPVTQVFKVLRSLDRDTREEIWDQIAPLPQPGATK